MLAFFEHIYFDARPKRSSSVSFILRRRARSCSKSSVSLATIRLITSSRSVLFDVFHEFLSLSSHGLTQGGWSKGDYAGRAADARIQVRLPSRSFHPDENQRSFGKPPPILLASVSLRSACHAKRKLSSDARA